jgi:hypothetical protein
MDVIDIFGIILLILALLAPFVEGFITWNMVQFFRGKKTPLEKISEQFDK